uniref:Uncharacterized protein n=1 Tax=Octopus bimaculoides TaxID=37653 RepID=A0A0L8GIZ3_OCTBM
MRNITIIKCSIINDATMGYHLLSVYHVFHSISPNNISSLAKSLVTLCGCIQKEMDYQYFK